MKSLFYPVLLICIVLFAVGTSAGQITITSSDVASVLLPGNTTTTHIDTSTHTANIGTLGSTSWDFSSIVTNSTSLAMAVRPDTTPYYADFPGSTHANKVGTIYEYFTLGSDLVFLGSGFSSSFDAIITNAPPPTIYQLPLTLGSNWTSTYAETTKVPSLNYTSVTGHVQHNVVDAYGPMTLPGGAVYQALRLRSDLQSTSNGITVRTIIYQFLTTTGATVSVTAADTNQADTGTINILGMSWNGPITTTAVEELPGSALPSQYSLDQNFPNPFNPATTIQFSIPENSFVSLKVFTLLGEEVSTLVSERLSRGTYSVQWDGSAFPSGLYLYRMQAGSMLDTKKLILLK